MDFDKLYNAYYMEVYSYMMALSRNPHTAEEITQEVFFKAMKTRHTYRGASGELSFQKIGRIFDKTETWARVTYHRARLKIQERMEEYGTEI